MSCHISPILHNLHWLPISFRIQYKINLLTFKALHGSAPPYLASMLQHRHARPGLRSSGSMLLVPRTRLASYGDRAFSNLAPRLWNSLPQSLRDTVTFLTSKTPLKHIFSDWHLNTSEIFFYWPGPAPLNVFTELVRLTNAVFIIIIISSNRMSWDKNVTRFVSLIVIEWEF